MALNAAAHMMKANGASDSPCTKPMPGTVVTLMMASGPNNAWSQILKKPILG